MIELSICIPTHNRAAILEESLRQLVPQCDARPVEICVSNNASPDHTAVVLSRYPQVRSITQLFNIGIDRNILAAMRMARGRYILPIGDDELIVTRGVDSILAALGHEPHMLMLNGWHRISHGSRPHLPRELHGRSLTDRADAFEKLWDKMPLGGYAIRRESAAARYADRYLGTHHAYSGAAWDYLLEARPFRIDCMSHPVVEFREVPKAWASDAQQIRTVEIPRWFDLIPAAYGDAVGAARSKYLRTWGRAPVGGGFLARAVAACLR